jgi:hypothetical protein
MMSQETAEILSNISEIAPMLHTAGPMSPQVLNAIYRRIERRRIRLSMETGSGASTLLLSHCSSRHLVFANDDGSGSINNVRASPLLNHSTVEFIEGPSQRTLPQFIFPAPIQLALLDGPHAYPFPELEYYYVYPALEPGALFILDDIHIKTVNNLFSFLKKDAMFRLDDVIGTTAFFTRTDAPVFCATGDGWQSQGYNKTLLQRYDWERQARELLPQQARRLIKRMVRTFQTDCRIWIDKPERGSVVEQAGLVVGRVKGSLRDRFLWVLVRREDQTGWWPQGDGPVAVSNGAWQRTVEYGGASWDHPWFEIAAILVNPSVNSHLLQWRANAETATTGPVEGFPFRSASVADAYRRVCAGAAVRS